jgi:hypothetical protein
VKKWFNFSKALMQAEQIQELIEVTQHLVANIEEVRVRFSRQVLDKYSFQDFDTFFDEFNGLFIR